MKKLLITRDLHSELMEGMGFLKRTEIAVITAATNEEILKELRHTSSADPQHFSPLTGDTELIR